MLDQQTARYRLTCRRLHALLPNIPEPRSILNVRRAKRSNPPDHISDLSEPFRSGPATKPTAIMPPTRTRGVAAKDNFSSRSFRFRPQITHLIPPIVSGGGGKKKQ